MKSGRSSTPIAGERGGAAGLSVDDAQRVLDDRAALAQVAAGDHDLPARRHDVLDDREPPAPMSTPSASWQVPYVLASLRTKHARDARSPATASSRAARRRARGPRARPCRRERAAPAPRRSRRSSAGSLSKRYLSKYSLLTAPDRSVNVTGQVADVVDRAGELVAVHGRSLLHRAGSPASSAAPRAAARRSTRAPRRAPTRRRSARGRRARRRRAAMPSAVGGRARPAARVRCRRRTRRSTRGRPTAT